jgi:vancomycin resistance protein YoaR
VLDYDKIAADILAGQRLVTAHLRDEHPERDTEWAQKLGIKRQVSSFTTKHPAGQPRVTNIHLAADALNNAVVEPGQTFSFNDYIGQRTPEKGYVKAPILVQDGFGEDYGGGVSQLVTTLYNAVFFGGYEDVEHSPHRFYISRYPAGREATINYPSVDLKFKNDTKYGVLIRVGYSSTSVTVTFFGDNEGRVVREENRKILKETPITDELISCPVTDPEDDPQNDCATLTAFEQKRVTTGEPGLEVEFDRVIEQPGKETRRRHYYKNYPMLPNKVLVGTVPPSTTTPATAPPTTTPPPPKSTSTTTRKP